METVDRMRQAFRAASRTYIDPALKDVVFCFTPVTAADMAHVDAQKPQSGTERSVLMLIHKMKKENGEPHFQMGQKHYLMTEVSAELLTRLVNEIYADTETLPDSGPEAVEKAELLIQQDPPSGSASA